MALSVPQIDAALDRLDQQRPTCDAEAFRAAAIASLRELLAADHACLVQPLTEHQFVATVASDPRVAAEEAVWLSEQLPAGDPADPDAAFRAMPRWCEASLATAGQACAHRFAGALAPDGWFAGGIVVRLPPNQPDTDPQTLRSVIEAYAELLYADFLERSLRHRKQLARDLLRAQQAIHVADDPETLQRRVVDWLSTLLPADRVSLLRGDASGKARLLAISHVDEFDRRADAILELESLAQDPPPPDRPRVLTSATASSNSGASRGVELSGGPCDAWLTCIFHWDHQHVIVAQWYDRANFRQSVSTFYEIVPVIQVAWQHAKRWQRLPVWLRNRAVPSRAARRRRWRRFLFVAVVTIVLIAATLWPVDFRLQAVGTLAPSRQHHVYVPHDGLVSQLQIAAGDAVRPGQTLLQIESPELDSQAAELEGRLREAEAKRAGTEVTVNQLARSGSPDPALENRLQAELRELAIRRENLKTQLLLVQQQRERLRITSPIAGTVVGWELERNLLGRPVRTGDVLFRIIPQEAPWHVRLAVADRDVGYLQQYAAEDVTEPVTATYALRARPEIQRPATVGWIAPEVVYDPDFGPVVEVHLDGVPAMDGAPLLGATVDGSLYLGRRPRWFVWGRPMIEALQRRDWF